jgi:hypothetical protein
VKQTVNDSNVSKTEEFQQITVRLGQPSASRNDSSISSERYYLYKSSTECKAGDRNIHWLISLNVNKIEGYIISGKFVLLLLLKIGDFSMFQFVICN